jgi:hypothetical protein
MVAHFENSRIRDRVKDLQPLLAAPQNPALLQGMEVTRDIRLGEAGRLGEVFHAFLAGLQFDKELQTVRLAKHAEAGGDHLQGCRRHVPAGGFFGCGHKD